MAQAAAPLVFGLLIDVMGSRVLIVSSALSLAALVALFLLRDKPPGFATERREFALPFAWVSRKTLHGQ